MNKEALKNAYSRYEEEGIILRIKAPEPPNSIYVKLSSEWPMTRNSETKLIQPGSGRLWDFIDRLGKCRREGKGRRDGAEVSTKVVQLADQLGEQLYRDASAAAAAAREKAAANAERVAEDATTDSPVEEKKFRRRSRL